VGNRVFPNGFVDLEMTRPANGGKVRFYGCSQFACDFTVEVDGQRTNCRFDDAWQVELPLKAGSGPVMIRLEKCGRDYPAFHAVVTL
ncbi:MAG: hypothetical protein IJH79_18070, partial [Lentisphaeria bacterium]|nr:hypothetical protein [Lentisphaeria bacterium]